MTETSNSIKKIFDAAREISIQQNQHTLLEIYCAYAQDPQTQTKILDLFHKIGSQDKQAFMDLQTATKDDYAQIKELKFDRDLVCAAKQLWQKLNNEREKENLNTHAINDSTLIN